MYGTNKTLVASVLAALAMSSACEVHLSCDTEPSASELHARGIEMLMKKQPGRAAEKFKQVIEMAPRDPQPRVSYCQALVQTQDHELALSACRKALEMTPGDPEVLYQLATLHVFSGQFEKARSLAVKALARAPGEPKNHAMLGVILLQLHDPARAIRHLEKGVSLDPGNRSTRRNLAIALAMCARCEAARESLGVARRLSDDGRAIGETIENNCANVVSGKTGQKAFSIDSRAVSGLEYSACVDDGACPKVPYGKFNRQPDYAQEPAMSIDFDAARAYCKHAGKRLPSLAEYRATWDVLEWAGCCARGVVPREWTSDTGRRKGTAIQVRKSRKGFEVKQTRKTRGVDSSTVRCARDLPAGCLELGEGS